MKKKSSGGVGLPSVQSLVNKAASSGRDMKVKVKASVKVDKKK